MHTGTALFGPESAAIAVPLMNSALVYLDQAKYSKAEQASRRVVELEQRSGSPRPELIASALGILGAVLSRQHKFVEAERVLREGIEAAEKLGATNQVVLAENLSNPAA
jgi:hypothetical protein